MPSTKSLGEDSRIVRNRGFGVANKQTKKPKKSLVDHLEFTAEFAPDEADVAATVPENSLFFTDRLRFGVFDVPIDKLVPGDNPRTSFTDEHIATLAATMVAPIHGANDKQRGLIQAIACRHDENRDTYVITAGETRWRAAKRAGLKTVRIEVLKETITDREAFERAMIENLARQDLSPLEEARGLRRMLDACRADASASNDDDPDASARERLLDTLGWSRQRLANKLRVLQLDDSLLAQVQQQPHCFSRNQLLDLVQVQEGQGVERALAALRAILDGTASAETAVSDPAKRPGRGRAPSAPKPPFVCNHKRTRAGGVRVALVARTTDEIPAAVATLRALADALERT